MKKVFLGGTCAESTWRQELISLLKVDYFNPVVVNWTPDCMQEELKQREICDYCLYVITPNMEGVYSIAEVIDDSNKQPTKTLFCVLASYDNRSFTSGQLKSLDAVGEMVKRNGGTYFKGLIVVSNYLNKK